LTDTNTRYLWERAVAKVHTLTGRINSTKKQLEHGSPQSSKIAEATLPSLQRQLDEAQAELVECERLKGYEYKASVTQSFKLNFRTDIMSDEESQSIAIPEFLRR
jgi:hypothetical protein